MPVPAFNEFNTLFDSLNAIGIDSVVPYKTERYTTGEFISRAWPVQPGSYKVFNREAAIAVVLLQGVSISDLSSMDLSGVAIAGTIATENLGIEHLTKNVVANPNIRNLILFGDEIQGHLPGDALLKLHEKGIDSKGRIIAARGARPILKNLTQIEVDHLRAQVQIVDLLGKSDAAALQSQIRKTESLVLPPFETGLRIDLVKPRKAEPARRLKLDRSGYFVIMVMPGNEQQLVVEHYTNDGLLRNMIEGNDAATICATIVDMNLVSQLDHAAYLGRELTRAELSIASDNPYVQDKAQGHSGECVECG